MEKPIASAKVPGDAETLSRTLPLAAPSRTAAAAVLALLLGGCSTYDAVFGEDIPPPPCPYIGVLPDANNIVKFRSGKGRDLIDIVHESELTNINTRCHYDIDEDTGEGTLSVEIGVLIDIVRGPANHNHLAEFAYFIVITDSSKTC